MDMEYGNYKSKDIAVEGLREAAKDLNQLASDVRVRIDLFRKHFDFRPDPKSSTKEHDEMVIEQRLKQLEEEWMNALGTFRLKVSDFDRALNGDIGDRKFAILNRGSNDLLDFARAENEKLREIVDACKSVVENGYRLPEQFTPFFTPVTTAADIS